MFLLDEHARFGAAGLGAQLGAQAVHVEGAVLETWVGFELGPRHGVLARGDAGGEDERTHHIFWQLMYLPSFANVMGATSWRSSTPPLQVWSTWAMRFWLGVGALATLFGAPRGALPGGGESKMPKRLLGEAMPSGCGSKASSKRLPL